MTNTDHEKYDHVNPLIVKYIADLNLKNPTILDIGCWRGALGRTLKEQRDCQVDGVDNSPEMKVAKTAGYRHLYELDLNTNFSVSPIKDQYDLIVLGDVLEHTADPIAVLEKLKTKLKPSGYFVISLPNVGFALYRLTHLLGIWRYTETGVMDRTHLRFFTLSSMRRFLNEVRLQTERQEGLSVVRPSLRFLAVLARIFPSLFALQIVTLAKPEGHK